MGRIASLAGRVGINTDPRQIDAPSMQTAIFLTQFFAREARRVYGMLSEPPEERDRRKLLALIASRGGEITPRELMRCTRQASTAEAAHRLLADLVQAGYGTWTAPPPSPSGGHAPHLFRLLAPPA